MPHLPAKIVRSRRFRPSQPSKPTSHPRQRSLGLTRRRTVAPQTYQVIHPNHIRIRRKPRRSRSIWKVLFGVILAIYLSRFWLGSLTQPAHPYQPIAGNTQTNQYGKTTFRRVNTATIVQRLRNAIIAQESNGNSKLVNESGSGALGFGQVMPEELASWSKEILGYELSQQEFLNRPDLQIKIMDHKLSEYWQAAIALANGNEDEAVLRVAAWWYSGDPHQYMDTTPQSWDEDLYPSIAEYSHQILLRYRS